MKEALRREIEMLTETYELEIRSAIRLLEDGKKNVSTHVGFNLAARASELSVLAGKIDSVKRVLAHLEVKS